MFRKLSAPTLRIASTDFQKFRDYLAREGFVFEDRLYQEFLARRTGVAVNLYSNGKVVIGGNDQVLIGSLREFVMSLGGEEVVKETRILEPLEIPFPHIGTDEVGKGDYFGPLVVAGTLVLVEKVESLRLLGVKDSKTLSDNTIRNIASQIRILLGQHRYEEISISPLEYNILYGKMQNVNKILGWAHASVIENLLAHGEDCKLALADQFGDPAYIQESLMNRGKSIELKQTHKAERDLAVAAASILARGRFLHDRERMCKDYNIVFPKGATDVVAFGKKFVEEHGISALQHVAKLHFSTTMQITSGVVPSIDKEHEDP